MNIKAFRNKRLGGNNIYHKECVYEKLTTIDFINRANKIHNNKYDYSISTYEYINKKIKILCKIHVSLNNCHTII